MRGAIGPDRTGAIHGEAHGQGLYGDVMHHLVEGALQEGRIDGAEGFHPLGREAGGEGHRVLFGDADIEGAGGKQFGEAVEPGARGHRRRDGDHP